MTTIATDGVTIAADGLGVSGSERVATSLKKLKVQHGRIYGLTGMSQILEEVIYWHNRGADPAHEFKGLKDPDWLLIVVDRYGLTSYSDMSLYPNSFHYPQAFGSGASYAVAAMHLGHSPAEAVKVASKLDVYTGGEIQVINIAEALGISTLEAAE